MTTATLTDYERETDKRKKGDVFEKLVAYALKTRYKGEVITERNLGSGTVFDALTTIDGRPIIIEIKHRKNLVSLSF